MRRFWRAAAAALLGMTAVVGALLSSAGPALAGPAYRVPPFPASVLAGTWVNTNLHTSSLVDLVVQTSHSGVSVDGFGACSPIPCEWGLIPATDYGQNVSADTGTSFEAQWNFGFSRTVLLARYADATSKNVPTLTVTELTTFTDSSGRSNYAVTETLVKGKAVRVTKDGTAASDYPLGNLVTPAATLPAVWVNTAANASLVAVILSVNANHRLEVRAFGSCSPIPCDWGLVTGITFGDSVTAKTGSTFLAPYVFSFAKKLVEGTVNAAGTQLTVQTWTEFTDSSARSNYETTDTFVPLR
jgi:hypothetical protein